MRRLATLLFVMLGACSQTPVSDPAPAPVAAPSTPTAAPPTVVPPIDVSALRADLTLFASDAFQGRLAGTPAARRAAEFIAERLTAAGLEPAVEERRHGPLGPMLAARAPDLERRGLLPAGKREEDVLVIAGFAGR